MTNSNGKKRRRLKKPVRKFLKRITIFTGAIVIIAILYNILDSPGKISSGGARVDNFRDINIVHLRHAQAKGITPFLTGKEFRSVTDNLVRKKKLVKIGDSGYYTVDKLTHSYPYLVPDAARLLDIIGERFHAKLRKNGKDIYQFRITSLLRTKESQRSLHKSNSNATPSISSHFYGTSFDITYKSLSKRNFLGREKTVRDPSAIRLLSETIGELRKEKKLVVVTEKREACFHITVR